MDRQVIVGFARSASPSDRRGVRRALSLGVIDRIDRAPIRLMEIGAGRSVRETVAALEEDPSVAFAEPNVVYRAVGEIVPDDPYLNDQWAFGTGSGAIRAREGWSVTQGSPETVVAIVDSGVDLGHPDLAPNLWRNAGEVPGNSSDDDGNGYVDDVHGYDWASGDGDPEDEHGHGTHVAGIAAARGDDGYGVAGTAWNVSIMPLRALDDHGVGTTFELTQAFAYAAEMGAEVVNASVGGSYSFAVEQVMKSSPSTLFVTAAGNGGIDGVGDNNDVLPTYPCSSSLPNVVCVAASDPSGSLASFSNRGAATVDLAAPGTGIVSTLPGNHHGTASGTSMASPFVAGVTALLWSAVPGASVADVRRALLDGTAPSSALTGKVGTGGLLDAFGALTALAPELVSPQTPSPSPSPVETPPTLPAPPPGAEDPSEELASDVTVIKWRHRLRVDGWISPASTQPAFVKVTLKKRPCK